VCKLHLHLGTTLTIAKRELSVTEILELAIASDEKYSTADAREARTDIILSVETLSISIPDSAFISSPIGVPVGTVAYVVQVSVHFYSLSSVLQSVTQKKFGMWIRQATEDRGQSSSTF
jgi:hypothetical protein